MNWKRTLGILWVSNFFVTAGMSLVIPFLPLYIDKLGVHQLQSIERWAGWVFSAQYVTSVIFQPIWGRVADKHGRKINLLRAGMGMGIVTALMGAVSSVKQLFLLRLLNGVFSGFISMSVSLQASITPNEDAGRALGMLQTGAVAGNLIGPLIGGVLAEVFGFRTVFFLTGSLLILASVIVMIFVQEQHEPKEIVESNIRDNLIKLKPLFPVFLASTVTQIGMMSIEPIVSIYAKTLYTGAHLATIAGLVVAISGVANLIGAPTLGRLGDRIGQRKVLILSFCAAVCMYIPQALAKNITVLLVGRFLLGLFIGGMIPSLNVLVKLKAPEELQATAFGFNSSSTFLGNLIGPLIGSSVAAAYGIRDVFYITMIVLLANAIMIFFNKNLDFKPCINGHKRTS
ncbi:MFS transporter [Clostridium thermopalmarium]|uniref:Tetracycline resistance protein, class B n=1 Tax=Clostridium thermopalmarium DSM 5974 TaxID=1121340 RepID=A0A2T0APS8_9CLOT|nr:MFS transporter [Clostridium thermopalmarium]MBE6042964.1 multidrug efflux MFS transporter [Clostridium thermopalmarium]PRR71016.1 Tetracycline resistance protein, class B [Clostridium thermopalmarium DSM 5974]PVZ23644.1 DHA1 family multidrug resistance protein-like MFS transporter [Clostridium thermopalmarium DSM 5974]